MAVVLPARKPRSRSAKGLATFARKQIERARHELVLIGGAYADVDQWVVDQVDQTVGFEALIEALADAEKSGRDAL